MQTQKETFGTISSSMLLFLKEVLDHYPVLTSDQERSLTFMIRQGNDDEKKMAEDKLVKSNFRLAMKLAVSRTGGGLEFNDLFQEACIALLEAAREYDPSRRTKFGTFAYCKIKARYRDCFGESLFLKGSHRLQEDALRYLSAAKEAAIICDHTPSQKEIADYLGWDMDRADNASMFLKTWVMGPFDETLPDYVVNQAQANKDQTASEAVSDLCGQSLERAVGNALTKRERFVITRRYISPGKQSSFASLAKELGMTAEGVRQIEIRALRKLRRCSQESIQ